MQSLSQLSDRDLKLNRQFKELTRVKRTYWDKQPVYQPHEFSEKVCHDPKDAKGSAVVKVQTAKETSRERTKIQDGFQWGNCDLNNEAQLMEVYDFLNLNYVEDDDGMFRFDYSTKLLQWALHTPGMDPDYLICIRIGASGKMVGFIAGIVVEIKTEALTKKMLEINFLCVDKMMRSKNFAPKLIAEVARMANTKGVFQAFYTRYQISSKSNQRASFTHTVRASQVLPQVFAAREADRLWFFVPPPKADHEDVQANTVAARGAPFERDPPYEKI